jgi:hypothetical protein
MSNGWWNSIYRWGKQSLGKQSLGKIFDTDHNIGVLTLKHELLAESLGVSSETLPPITENDSEQVQDNAL